MCLQLYSHLRPRPRPRVFVATAKTEISELEDCSRGQGQFSRIPSLGKPYRNADLRSTMSWVAVTTRVTILLATHSYLPWSSRRILSSVKFPSSTLTRELRAGSDPSTFSHNNAIFSERVINPWNTTTTITTTPD